MKNVKKFFVSMATCAFAASLGVGFGLVNASAETISVSDLTESNVIQMQAGAEARVDGTSAESYNGLRFTMLVDDTTAESLSGANYGMLIAPVDYVDTYGALSLDNPNYVWGSTAVGNGQAKIINVWGNELTEGKAGDGFKEFRGVIYDIQESNLDRAFVGVGYVKDGTGFKMATLADNSRSIATIAQTALNGTYASTTGNETYLAKRSVLTGWASKIAWRVDFKDDYGDVVKQQWVTKGETAGAAPEVTARDLYDFNAWTYADGTAYNAENAVTANTVVKQSWNVKPLKVTMDRTGTQHMHIGAAKAVALNGQKLIMSYDVESSTIDADTKFGGIMIEKDPENTASVYPYVNKGSTLVFANSSNGALTQVTGRDDETTTITTTGAMTMAGLYEVGYSYKIEYQPYVAATETTVEILGGISVYRKKIMETAYTLWTSLSGLAAVDAPDKAGLYLSNYSDITTVLHNFAVKTEDGRNLGIQYGATSGSTIKVETMGTYTIEGTGSLVFGSKSSVAIATGETLEMQFDILSFAGAYNGNFGITVSGYVDAIDSWGSSTPYLNNNSFMAYINYLSSANVVFTGKSGSVKPAVELNSNFSYAKYFKAGTTIKVVYKPYESEENMGWLKLYKKTTGSTEDWTLGYSITGIDAGYGPSQHVKIGIVSYTRTDLKMEVANFRISTAGKSVPVFASKGTVTVTEGVVTEEATV